MQCLTFISRINHFIENEMCVLTSSSANVLSQIEHIWVIFTNLKLWAALDEMNGVLGHLCAHIGSSGPGESPEDDEMNEMTLSSRHRIRNSSPGGMRSSTLPLGHWGFPQYWIITSERGRNILFIWNLKARVKLEPARSHFPSRQL